MPGRVNEIGDASPNKRAGWAASMNRGKTTKSGPRRFSPGVENEWAHGGTGQPNLSVCLFCETNLLGVNEDFIFNVQLDHKQAGLVAIPIDAQSAGRVMRNGVMA